MDNNMDKTNGNNEDGERIDIDNGSLDVTLALDEKNSPQC